MRYRAGTDVIGPYLLIRLGSDALNSVYMFPFFCTMNDLVR